MNIQRSSFVALCMAALLFGPVVATAFAQDTAPLTQPAKSFLDEPDNASTPADTPNMAGTLVRLVLAMLLVFAVLVGAVLMLQKLSRRGLSLSGGADRPLRVIDKLSIGPKQGVYLLNTAGKYLLLGVTEKEMSVLMELTPTDDESAKDFARIMQKYDKPRSGASQAKQ